MTSHAVTWPSFALSENLRVGLRCGVVYPSFEIRMDTLSRAGREQEEVGPLNALSPIDPFYFFVMKVLLIRSMRSTWPDSQYG